MAARYRANQTGSRARVRMDVSPAKGSLCPVVRSVPPSLCHAHRPEVKTMADVSQPPRTSQCLINVDLTRNGLGGQLHPTAPMEVSDWPDGLLSRNGQALWQNQSAFRRMPRAYKTKCLPQHQARLRAQGGRGPAMLEAASEPDLPWKVALIPAAAEGASRHLQVPVSLCPVPYRV